MNISQNNGISFGLLKNSSSSVILLLNCFVALFLAEMGLFIGKNYGETAMYGAALMLGGCLGNFCDRLFLGQVTDWIYVPYSKIFFSDGLMLNIADFAVIFGFCLTFYPLFYIKKGALKK